MRGEWILPPAEKNMDKTEFDPTCRMHRTFLANEVKVLLLGLGFTPSARQGATELVFEKASSRLQGVKMLVFTTIQNDEVRGIGKDSIKVCTVYTNRKGLTLGLGKERRVHRTGEITGIAPRITDRIKSSAADINNFLSCESCGAPKFKSKAGNMVCAEICWKK